MTVLELAHFNFALDVDLTFDWPTWDEQRYCWEVSF